VLRRSEVVSVEVVEISPIENALLEVEQKNKELSALNVKYSNLAKTTQVVSTNPLSMALNNVVDAPAGGGIASYRTPFMMPGYVLRYPDRGESVEKLRTAVEEQVRAEPRLIGLAHLRSIDPRSASSLAACDFMVNGVHQKC
jgi:dedicator of cytokinesis protein 3